MNLIKKQSFTLMEVMIGLMIITLLGGYFIYQPFSALKKEISQLYHLEQNRLWKLKLLQIQATLPSQAASLPRNIRSSDLKRVDIPLFIGQKEIKTSKYYYLITEKQKIDKEGKSYFLVALHERDSRGRITRKQPHKFFVTPS